ncbi:hypothetical protein DFH08DRAFT_932283 [Mycena albidolilacea]|uniref:Uncharacterized protein n=1 Tax=Mycena albidolilacea TaxID=1033008 RepID=A0AAD7EZ00_9AGAR|nr:hypothetical protein DFH08DRAFT_932283 [Mycena albidolilacea]
MGTFQGQKRGSSKAIYRLIFTSVHHPSSLRIMPPSAPRLYRGLTCHKHGIPQFTPEPNQRLPPDYQEIGVSLGDVGIWHGGSFEVLFNTCQPATSSINGAHGVPKDFSVFPLHSRDIAQRPYHSPGTIISSTKVSQVTLTVGASSAVNPFFPTTMDSSIRFKFESEQGAILVLPDGASRQDLLPDKTLRAHARKYSPQWYRYAREHTGPLFVVTGCDKTTSWGIATASASSGAVGISLKFAVVGIAEGTLSPQYQWRDFGSATVHRVLARRIHHGFPGYGIGATRTAMTNSISQTGFGDEQDEGSDGKDDKENMWVPEFYTMT